MCAHPNAPDAKFCSQCAAALGSRAAAGSDASDSAASRDGVRAGPEQSDGSTTIDGERKTVTALFADIKGSTELMRDLDPEEARSIIDPALKLMMDAVHRYDGYVVQSTGDGIFALFGAPVAHEDHPQRALYAAMRMQEELKRYSTQVVADGSTPIQGRVGINTGEVVVRSIQTGAGQVEYTPFGHTTNLASRMQTAAPVGSIAVSEATRRLCEGYFTLKPLGATRVKGVSEPVNVYEVTGLGPLRTRLQRSAGRVSLWSLDLFLNSKLTSPRGPHCRLTRGKHSGAKIFCTNSISSMREVSEAGAVGFCLRAFLGAADRRSTGRESPTLCLLPYLCRPFWSAGWRFEPFNLSPLLPRWDAVPPTWKNRS